MNRITVIIASLKFIYKIRVYGAGKKVTQEDQLQ